MCTYFICLVSLLVALVLAEPVFAEDIAGPDTPGWPLCPFVRSAAAEAQLEAEARDRMHEIENLPAIGIDSLPPFRASGSMPRADRRQFESLLANWLFFEDLAPEQRKILQAFLGRCGVAADRPSLAASVFGQLNASQRATFVGVTHAMMHTLMTDGTTQESLGDTFGLVQELIDIQGENMSLPSDHQFQLVVALAPDARAKLERMARFDKGINHIFHKDFPLSYRQIRKIGLRGQEAGLHLCLTRDGRFAQIHIDYRFGLLHLGPANSDVRANGNHQRHADRWPEFTLAARPQGVPRIVLSHVI